MQVNNRSRDSNKGDRKDAGVKCSMTHSQLESIYTQFTINSCNIGTSALPDMYARWPRAR